MICLFSDIIESKYLHNISLQSQYITIKNVYEDMRRIVFLSFIYLLFASQLIAQHQKLKNLPYADYKVFHFGFTLGFHTQDLRITQSGYENDNGEVWFSEIPSYSPGFSVGLITDLYLNPYMNLRAIPTIHLGGKNLIFKEQSTGDEFKTTTKNNYITLPLQIKFHGDRINNYRPYIVTGGYGSIEIAPRKNNPVLLKPIDYGIEVGVGCDFYLSYFKLSPEIKYCFGLTDIYERNREDLVEKDLMKYPLSISKTVQQMIVLSFNFE